MSPARYCCPGSTQIVRYSHASLEFRPCSCQNESPLITEQAKPPSEGLLRLGLPSTGPAAGPYHLQGAWHVPPGSPGAAAILPMAAYPPAHQVYPAPMSPISSGEELDAQPKTVTVSETERT